jgi:uncharacterized protein (DUF305 family)
MKRMKGGKSSHHASTGDQKPRVEETRQAGSSHAGTSHSSGTSHEGAGAATGRTSHDSAAASHHASSGAHEQMKKETMSKLESVQGAEFDRVFVDEMLKHHKMAKEMAQLAQQQSSREDIRSFAAKIVQQQAKEEQELKGLNK